MTRRRRQDRPKRTYNKSKVRPLKDVFVALDPLHKVCEVPEPHLRYRSVILEAQLGLSLARL